MRSLLIVAAFFATANFAEEISNGAVAFSIKASDPQGENLKFNWKVMIGRPSVDIDEQRVYKDDKGKWHSKANFYFKEPGEYVVRATVMNSGGEVSTRDWYHKVAVGDKTRVAAGALKAFSLNSPEVAAGLAAPVVVTWKQVGGPPMQVDPTGKWFPKEPGRYEFEVVGAENAKRRFVHDVAPAGAAK